MLDFDATTIPGRPCSMAATLSLVGEKWALLAIREIFWGNHRFDEIARNTGAPRDRLAARLRGPYGVRKALLKEVDDGLRDAAEAYEQAGVPPAEAGPLREDEECRNKAAAVLRAVAVASTLQASKP